MKRIWEELPALFAAVRKSHEEVGLVGHHDFVHAARVGEIAWQIAFKEWGFERLALLSGAAGLCHNADRVLQKKFGVGRREVPKKKVEKLVLDWLLTESEFRPPTPTRKEGAELRQRTVIDAVLGHDGRNSPDDPQVLIALMDADRIVNLDIDLFPRSGQHYHDLPVVDYKHFLDDPEATYRSPKSVLKDISYSLDWADQNTPVCVRTKLGKKLAGERATTFRIFFRMLNQQLEQEGISPYPFD